MKIFLSFLFMFVCIVLGAYIVYRVQTGQKIIPSFASETWLKIEDKDSRLSYVGFVENKNAGQYKARGGTYRQSQDSSNAGFSSDKITLNLTSGTIYFDQVKIGYLSGPRRVTATVSVDSKKIGTMNTKTASYVSDYSKITPWQSPVFECGKHTVTIQPNPPTPPTPTAVLQFDYIDLHECTPEDTKFLVCSDNRCAFSTTATSDSPTCAGKTEGFSPCDPDPNNHLICENNACKKVSGAGTDATGCMGQSEGFSPCNGSAQSFVVCGSDNTCQSSSTATSNDPGCSGLSVGQQCRVNEADLICQGNKDAPARCFDCKRDIGPSSTTSEINILDFSCFAKFYGKEVGKN